MKRAPFLTKDAHGAGAGGVVTRDFTFNIDTKDVNENGEFEGYASVWNIVDQGGDKVLPGAFTSGLVKAKNEGRFIPMLWQHDRTRPIGKWLDISEDTRGLYVKGRLLIGKVAQATEAHELLLEAALGGLSIGYRVPLGGAEEDEKARGVWLLKEIQLIEISLVTLPMLVQARVTAVKGLLEAGRIPSTAEFVELLKETGFPAALAMSIGEKAAPLLRADPAQTEGGEKTLVEALSKRLQDFCV